MFIVEIDKTFKWLAEQLEESICTISKWFKNSILLDFYMTDKIEKLINLDVRILLKSTEIIIQKQL